MPVRTARMRCVPMRCSEMPRPAATSFAPVSAVPWPKAAMREASRGLASRWTPNVVTPTYVITPSAACASRNSTMTASPKRERSAAVRCRRTRDLQADQKRRPRPSLPIGPDPDHVTEEETGCIPVRLQEAITAGPGARNRGPRRFCPKTRSRVKGRPTFREEAGKTTQPEAEAVRRGGPRRRRPPRARHEKRAMR